MNKKRLIKEKILKCLTEDFKNNQAIFNKKEGYSIFSGTDLEMVMEKVVKGIDFAFDNESELKKRGKKMIPEQILNPKGCGKDCSIGLIPYICGKTEYYNSPKDDKGKIFLCKECKEINKETREKLKKAQAQVLLDEKKSDLEFLESLDTEAMLNEQSKKIENKIQELQEEIKILEGVLK